MCIIRRKMTDKRSRALALAGFPGVKSPTHHALPHLDMSTTSPQNLSASIVADVCNGIEVDDQLKSDHASVHGVRKRIPLPPMVDARSRILWENVGPFVVFHALIPLAFFPYFFSWWGLLFLPIGNYLFCSMGIGAGYHRLLTHRGFQCPKWFEYTLATLGMCSLQDSPIRWALVHRLHHQHSDHQPDPHTPMAGTFWSHVGWMFLENRQLDNAATYDRYARDLLKDRFYFTMQRGGNWALVYVAHAVAIFLLGLSVGWLMTGDVAETLHIGILWFLWGVIYRTIYTWHVTAAINSAAHLWGYRNYETRENSRNNWLFALLTNGEGWHNNHHADPRSAQHGHRWWELDVTYLTLRFCEKIGLVWNITGPNKSVLDRRAI